MSPDDKIYYHYTSIEGMYGILSSNSLWLSDAKQMNDYSEIQIGVSILQKDVDRGTISENHGAISLIRDFCPRAAFYICSFSEDDDSLSQWRAYADDGYGVALGFTIDEERFAKEYQLARPRPSPEQEISMLKVDYIDLDSFSFLIYQEIFDYLTDPYLADRDPTLEHTTSALYKKIMSIKNEAFLEEREFRLAACVHGDIQRMGGIFPGLASPHSMSLDGIELKLRQSNRNIHRYLSIPINTNGFELVEVIKGPQCKVETENIRLAVQKFLQIDKIRVDSSKATYRTS